MSKINIAPSNIKKKKLKNIAQFRFILKVLTGSAH